MISENIMPALPIEIFSHIVEHMDASGLALLCKVSKEVKVIAMDDRLWKALFPNIEFPENSYKQFLDNHSVCSLEAVAERINEFITGVKPREWSDIKVLFPFNNGCFFNILNSEAAQIPHYKNKPLFRLKEIQIFVKKLEQDNTVQVKQDQFDMNTFWTATLPCSSTRNAESNKKYCESIINVIESRQNIEDTMEEPPKAKDSTCIIS